MLYQMAFSFIHLSLCAIFGELLGNGRDKNNKIRRLEIGLLSFCSKKQQSNRFEDLAKTEKIQDIQTSVSKLGGLFSKHSTHMRFSSAIEKLLIAANWYVTRERSQSNPLFGKNNIFSKKYYKIYLFTINNIFFL